MPGRALEHAREVERAHVHVAREVLDPQGIGDPLLDQAEHPLEALGRQARGPLLVVRPRIGARDVRDELACEGVEVPPVGSAPHAETRGKHAREAAQSRIDRDEIVEQLALDADRRGFALEEFRRDPYHHQACTAVAREASLLPGGQQPDLGGLHHGLPHPAWRLARSDRKESSRRSGMQIRHVGRPLEGQDTGAHVDARDFQPLDPGDVFAIHVENLGKTATSVNCPAIASRAPTGAQ
jgi:hypothetical protein